MANLFYNIKVLIERYQTIVQKDPASMRLRLQILNKCNPFTLKNYLNGIDEEKNLDELIEEINTAIKIYDFMENLQADENNNPTTISKVLEQYEVSTTNDDEYVEKGLTVSISRISSNWNWVALDNQKVKADWEFSGNKISDLRKILVDKLSKKISKFKSEKEKCDELVKSFMPKKGLFRAFRAILNSLMKLYYTVFKIPYTERDLNIIGDRLSAFKEALKKLEKGSNPLTKDFRQNEKPQKGDPFTHSKKTKTKNPPTIAVEGTVKTQIKEIELTKMHTEVQKAGSSASEKNTQAVDKKMEL